MTLPQEIEQESIKLMEAYWYEDMTDNPAGITEHALRLARHVISERLKYARKILNGITSLPRVDLEIKEIDSQLKALEEMK